MNNNVFIYVVQEKDKFPRCGNLFKTEIFTLLSVSRNPLPLMISKKYWFQLSVLDPLGGTESIARRHQLVRVGSRT